MPLKGPYEKPGDQSDVSLSPGHPLRAIEKAAAIGSILVIYTYLYR